MTPEEQKAADEKAAADKAIADKAAADKKALDDKKASDDALKARLDAADAKRAEADAEIAKMKDKIAAADKKGKNTDDLEGRLAEMERANVDLQKQILQLNETNKAERERANSKTIETDLRKTLDGQLIDGGMDAAIKLLRADGRVRVDGDGKLAVDDGAGNWGSLTSEALMKHLPDFMKASAGVPGSGADVPGAAGRPLRGNIVEAAMGSQEEYRKRRKEILALQGRR